MKKVKQSVRQTTLNDLHDNGLQPEKKAPKKNLEDIPFVSTKVISYEPKDLGKQNVVHVGTHDNWIYYFGYSYVTLPQQMELLKDGLMDDIAKISNDPKGKKVKALKEEMEKNLEELLASNSPLEHVITERGIFHLDDVDKPHIDTPAIFKEMFFAYEKYEVVDNKTFIDNYKKYNNDTTVNSLHVSEELRKEINGDNTYHKEKRRHVIDNLWGLIPTRLSIYQGDSYYKYIYDTSFWMPDMPWLFNTKYSHVILKPDNALDDDGYYNLTFLEYDEKSFSNTYPNLYKPYDTGLDNHQELFENPIYNRRSYKVSRPEHEYVGSFKAGTSMFRIGMKNPPRWLERLLRGVATYKSRDFLMCRAEEFEDQWNVLLLEHFDSFDYDISKEYSPFVGYPALYTLTGHRNFRTFTPRWLTMFINSFLLGHDNLEQYKIGGMYNFLERGNKEGVIQRSIRGYFNEKDIKIPISTPIGDFLYHEGHNFPPYKIWDELKDKLVDIQFYASKEPEADMAHTSTELVTKEFKVRWFSLFGSYQKANGNMEAYNSIINDGLRFNIHPNNPNLLLSPKTPYSNYNDYMFSLGKHVDEDVRRFGHLNTKDFNGVVYEHDKAKYLQVDSMYGKAFETSTYNRDDLDIPIREIDKRVIIRNKGETDEEFKLRTNMFNTKLAKAKEYNVFSHRKEYSFSKRDPKIVTTTLDRVEEEVLAFIKNT